MRASFICGLSSYIEGSKGSRSRLDPNGPRRVPVPKADHNVLFCDALTGENPPLLVWGVLVLAKYGIAPLEAAAYRRRGFTVTELLVVIAVILLLAAFLLPSLAKAKQRGRLTRCQSNLRQISLGLLQYADTIT